MDIRNIYCMFFYNLPCCRVPRRCIRAVKRTPTRGGCPRHWRRWSWPPWARLGCRFWSHLKGKTRQFLLERTYFKCISISRSSAVPCIWIILDYFPVTRGIRSFFPRDRIIHPGFELRIFWHGMDDRARYES